MPQIIGQSPVEFFRDTLIGALQRERLTLDLVAEYYVVRLLVSESRTANHPAEPLCDVYARAIFEKTRAVRAELFKFVGDRALLSSGLWWEFSLRRHGRGESSSLAQLGRSAYGTIGEDPFEELAEKFEGIANAIARLGTDANLGTARDILRLYTLWEETGSAQAARALTQRGFILRPTAASAPF